MNAHSNSHRRLTARLADIGLMLFAAIIWAAPLTGCDNPLAPRQDEVYVNMMNNSSDQLMYRIYERIPIYNPHGGFTPDSLVLVVDWTQMTAKGMSNQDHFVERLKPSHQYTVALYYINGKFIQWYDFQPDGEFSDRIYDGVQYDTIVYLAPYNCSYDAKPGRINGPARFNRMLVKSGVNS